LRVVHKIRGWQIGTEAQRQSNEILGSPGRPGWAEAEKARYPAFVQVYFRMQAATGKLDADFSDGVNDRFP
jgi:hypothetical protein